MKRFVVVNGPPGSGKTTISADLAERLGLPLFAKDAIKEALADHLGVIDADESISSTGQPPATGAIVSSFQSSSSVRTSSKWQACRVRPR